MNKSELITAISERGDLQKAQADRAVKALIEVIHEQVASGNEVSLPDLGKFVRVEKSARAGRNPITGEAMEIAARKSPAFKAAKAFKDIVNK